MEAIPRDYGQGQFDAFCKKVLKNEARAYLRNMKRQRDRETMFSDLPQHELDKLCTVDRYPSDSFVFSSHGYDLHIDNELTGEIEFPKRLSDMMEYFTRLVVSAERRFFVMKTGLFLESYRIVM